MKCQTEIYSVDAVGVRSAAYINSKHCRMLVSVNNSLTLLHRWFHRREETSPILVRAVCCSANEKPIQQFNIFGCCCCQESKSFAQNYAYLDHFDGILIDLVL